MTEFYLERIGPFILFPVVHHSYEFALSARAAFHSLKPRALALEYPQQFESEILKGIHRLPRISVLVFGSKTKNYIRIEPVDPFVEASRCAIQAGIKVRCIDLCLENYPSIFDPVPDTYALSKLRHLKYCEMILNSKNGVKTEEDEHRERAMAFYLQDFHTRLSSEKEMSASDAPILVLCGITHMERLQSFLSSPQAQPFEKRVPGKLYHLSSNSLGEVMGCFPFLSSVFEHQRASEAQNPEPVVPVTVSVEPEETTGIRLLHGKKSETALEFSTRAAQEIAASVGHDRAELVRHYLARCREFYEKEIGERISPQQSTMLERFARKYSDIKGMLLPDFYELLIAGRGSISSHFCYRMWEIGSSYAPQAGPTDLEVIELRAKDLSAFVNKVRMNPHPPLKPRSPFPKFLNRKQKQARLKKDQWWFTPYSICSYQPEDLAIENYGNYLRGKGKNILSEERKRVQPFETSLLDGIDLRETIRNWHTGQIFVQECRTVKAEIGSLVVIFDEDSQKYPYTMTWLGEHHQESDMAFYATDPEERSAGPGIRKSVYGGFLMTMPPGRLFDVFGDPAYSMATNYSERLLLAAIDYGLEKFVVYAALKPPRPIFQTIAGRYGKRVLYIPLSQLSPVALQKIRTFHILADKSVREYAKDYIW
jgi:hypothetical protein